MGAEGREQNPAVLLSNQIDQSPCDSSLQSRDIRHEKGCRMTEEWVPSHPGSWSWQKGKGKAATQHKRNSEYKSNTANPSPGSALKVEKFEDVVKWPRCK